MDQDTTLTPPNADADEATITGQPDGSDAAAQAAAPAEGSDAAASLGFGRNLLRLREARSLSHNQLAALADIAVDSIRDYELGKYRPQKPSLWALAEALDVMPIVLGNSATRGGEAPEPVEALLSKKTGRSPRLQHLVELLSPDKRVSTFAELVGMEPAEVYAVASSDTQLTEEQLEPFFRALPQVRREWLMSGKGASIVAVESSTPASAPPAATEPAAPVMPAAEAAPRAPERTLPSVFASAPLAAPSVQPLSIAVPAVAGVPMYVPLGLGLVAEVDAVLLSGAGAVSGFRLLAGAGGVPVLTSADQLEHLFYALRGVLDQRAAE